MYDFLSDILLSSHILTSYIFTEIRMKRTIFYNTYNIFKNHLLFFCQSQNKSINKLINALYKSFIQNKCFMYEFLDFTKCLTR